MRPDGYDGVWGTLTLKLGGKRDPLYHINKGMNYHTVIADTVKAHSKAERALWHARNMGIDTCPADSAIKLILIIDKEHAARYMNFAKPKGLPTYDAIPEDIYNQYYIVGITISN
jgi:hypothetical protein